MMRRDLDAIAQMAHDRCWLRGSCLVDTEFKVQWASKSLEPLVERRLDEIIGASILDWAHPDDLAVCAEILAYESEFDASVRHNIRQRNVRDVRALMPDGSYRTLEVALTNFFADPEIGMVLLDVAAPTQFRHLDAILERGASEPLLTDILHALLAEFTSSDPGQPAAAIVDRDGRVLASSPNAPIAVGELIGCIAGCAGSAFAHTWKHDLVSNSHGVLGTIHFWCQLATPHPLDREYSERVARYASCTLERDLLLKELETAALTDPLTGLANRRAFEMTIRERGARGDCTTLVYVDLDRFKQLNDVRGHSFGDQVLVEVANRLRDSLRRDDIAARMGGDEFVLLLTGDRNDPYNTDLESLTSLRTRLFAVLHEPMTIEGRNVCINASIGISTGSSDIDELLRDADAEMLRQKREAHAARNMLVMNHESLTSGVPTTT